MRLIQATFYGIFVALLLSGCTVLELYTSVRNTKSVEEYRSASKQRTKFWPLSNIKCESPAHWEERDGGLVCTGPDKRIIVNGSAYVIYNCPGPGPKCAPTIMTPYTYAPFLGPMMYPYPYPYVGMGWGWITIYRP